MDPNTSLTSQMWSDIDGIYREILAHPFLAGLTDGSLPRDVFQHYVAQDFHYISGFSKALGVLAGRAGDPDTTLLLARHAAGTLEAEHALHAELLGKVGMDLDDLHAIAPSPTTTAYTSYVLATCHGGSFAEGVAAVLPCYWIYREVGRTLVERGSADALYQRWIDTYADEEYAVLVREVIDLTDELGAATGAAERARMRGHVVTTSRYEWMFWDAAWRQESWPV